MTLPASARKYLLSLAVVATAVPQLPSVAAPAPTHAPPTVDQALRREPAYPAAAAARGEEGTVVLRLTVAPDGTVQDAEVKTSSGHAELDRAALDAAQSWTFKRGELPRWSSANPWLLVPITFVHDGLRVSSPL